MTTATAWICISAIPIRGHGTFFHHKGAQFFQRQTPGQLYPRHRKINSRTIKLSLPATDPDYGTLFDEQRWEEAWSKGVEPGDFFDKLKPLPELVNQLSNGSFPTNGTALVPGCGRGYDVELLCKAGFTATGLDISPTAVAAAKEYLESVSDVGEFRLVCGDFFTDAVGTFDLVYDFSFFCAIPPKMREAWGRRMAEFVKKDGTLITTMSPMKRDVEEGGPPFGVSEKEYRDVLGDAFVAVDGPRQLDEESTHPGGGDGNTWWCRWKRV